jgi:microcompartment protein CcmK/EutM
VILGIVRGNITSTIHHPFFGGQKMMIVDECDEQFQPTGKYLIAVDAVGVGPGERVLLLNEGNGSRQIVGDSTAPLRSMIVAIVDEATTG